MRRTWFHIGKIASKLTKPKTDEMTDAEKKVKLLLK